MLDSQRNRQPVSEVAGASCGQHRPLRSWEVGHCYLEIWGLVCIMATQRRQMSRPQRGCN